MRSFKVCIECMTRKPIDEFVKHITAIDGHRNICLPCNRIRNRASYKRRRIFTCKDPDLVAARSSRRSENQEIREALGNDASRKIIQMHLSAKCRAKKKGLKFDVTPSDLLELYVERCPILNIKLNWSGGGGRRGATFDSPSLDRKIPSLGYVKDNLWIISYRANTIKSDATPEELIAVADAMFYC